MPKKAKTFFVPVIDCTASDFLFTSEEKALTEAKKMFRRKEFNYLRGLPKYKNFKTALATDVIYTIKYSVKE